MQTPGRESHQAGEKIANARWVLFVTLLFPYVLLFTFFSVLIDRFPPHETTLLIGISGLVLLSAVLAGLSISLALGFMRERARLERRLARAERLVVIADILNGSALNHREKMRQVSAELLEEGSKAGWRCRIMLTEEELHLPPREANLGDLIPISVEDTSLGALLVTPGKKPLEDEDRDFFESLRNYVALYVAREKAWNDSKERQHRMEVALLLKV